MRDITVKRKQHWENVYADKSPLEVSWYQQQPEISLHLIQNACVDNNAAIIDVGGGASTLVDHLYANGYKNIAVLDISEAALKHTQERLGSISNDIEWIISDITEYKASHPVDIWHDRAVFHFLTDESDRKKYIRALKKSLTPGGNLIIAAFAIGGPTRCSGLDIVQYDAGKMQVELGDDFQLVEQHSETHTTPSNASQAFTYYKFSYRPQ